MLPALTPYQVTLRQSLCPSVRSEYQKPSPGAEGAGAHGASSTVLSLRKPSPGRPSHRAHRRCFYLQPSLHMTTCGFSQLQAVALSLLHEYRSWSMVMEDVLLIKRTSPSLSFTLTSGLVPGAWTLSLKVSILLQA